MLDDLLKRTGGHEILTRRELFKDEIGVELQSEFLHGYYAFPDRISAVNFMDQAVMPYVTETHEITCGTLFENVSLFRRILHGIASAISYLPWRNKKLSDAEFEAKVIESLQNLDQQMWGMSLEEATAIANDENRQDNFESEFGITYHEYLHRCLTLGEKMGESMVNGRWRSIL